MRNVYGYICFDNFIETGFTEKGAKIAATKNNCNHVGYRSYINNMYIETSIKQHGKWCKV